MTAADYAKSHHSPVIPLLATFTELCDKDDYRGLAEAYVAFTREHPTSRFMALEPIPFKISDHLVKKHGSSSAVTTFTLRRSTWANEVQVALDEGIEPFVALMQEIDGEVAAITAKSKKLS